MGKQRKKTMKKLIVFAAIAVAAVVSQAAAVSWSYVSSSNEKDSHIYLVVGSTLPSSIDNITT